MAHGKTLYPQQNVTYNSRISKGLTNRELSLLPTAAIILQDWPQENGKDEVNRPVTLHYFIVIYVGIGMNTRPLEVGKL